MESDRERIFQKITDSIGMDEFNRQLQEYLEGEMRAAAMEALLQRGGPESVGAGGSKATIGVLRAELEQAKQVLTKGKEETKRLAAAQAGIKHRSPTQPTTTAGSVVSGWTAVTQCRWQYSSE
jgi:hypothetical protein